MARRSNEPSNKVTIDTSYTEIFPIENDTSRSYHELSAGRFREIDDLIMKGFGRGVEVSMEIYTDYAHKKFTRDFLFDQNLLNAIGNRSIYRLLEEAEISGSSIRPEDIEYRIVEVNVI